MTMKRDWLHLANCRLEILSRDGHKRAEFIGLGAIYIGETQVRSGVLPLRPETQTFPDGLIFDRLWLRGIKTSADETRIELAVAFRPAPMALMRDHSFDPIHNSDDWNSCALPEETLALVLRPARDAFNDIVLEGFSYHYEYSASQTPLFHLLDKASWELGGDIEGAAAVSQSSCCAPTVTFENATAWSTEGVIYFDERAQKQNPVMTHNLPRWASHGAFDFQYKGASTLVGVFERVELIRSLLKREAGKAELKCFDKHLFDQSMNASTSPKKILLNTQAKTEIDQQNLWTWIQDEVYERARAEFGLCEEPITPRLSQNYWVGFTVEDYQRDLLPAADTLGIREIFIDNLNKSDLTFGHPTPSSGNMCCGHEYEIASELGGADGVAAFVARCREHGIEPYAWTNNGQSLSSPLQSDPDKRDWFVKMEDSRLNYGGAYSNVFSILNFKKDAPRRYWIEALKRIKRESGLAGYLFDSFYNLGFMPIDYSELTPTTQWREVLRAFKELQDEGIHFLIESFGPFGQVQHGCPASYNLDTLFVCYKIMLGSGYTTIPGGEILESRAHEAAQLYRILAHMTGPLIPLFVDGERIDKLWSEAHQQALADFDVNRDWMYRRYLQPDGDGVLWHSRDQRIATLWNFTERDLELPGRVINTTTGEVTDSSLCYRLLPCQTYRIEVSSPAELPQNLTGWQAATEVVVY